MFPIFLKIDGIKSYSKPTAIDFSFLSSEKLFCISGGTGAGKSTIYDCILLALFGKSGAQSVRDFINSARDKAVIEFTFLHNDKTYTVWREYKSVSGSVTNSRASLSEGDTVIANGAVSVTDKIRGILSLDFNEFVNVVMLRQGEYAKFLSGSAKEQAEIVCKVFSLERFDKLSTKFAERKRFFEEKLNDLNAELEGDNNLKKGDITRLEGDIKAELNNDKKRVKEQNNLEKLIADMAAVRDKYLAWQNTVAQLQALQGDLTTLEDKMSTLNVQKAQLATLKPRQDELNKAVESAAATAAELNVLLQKKQQLTADKASLEKLDEQLKEIQTEHKAACDLAEQLGKKMQLDQKLLAKLKSELEGINEKNAAKAVTELNLRKQQFKSLFDSRKEQGAEQNKLSKLKDDAVNQFAVNSKAVSELTVELEKATEKLKSINRNFASAAIAVQLKEGDTCPVCGGKFHAQDIDADIENQLKSAEALVSSLREKLQSAQSQQNLYSTLTSDYTQKLDEISIKIAQFDDAYRKAASGRAAMYLDRIDDIAALSDCAARLSVSKPELENAEIKVKHLAENITRMTQERETLLKNIQDNLVLDGRNIVQEIDKHNADTVSARTELNKLTSDFSENEKSIAATAALIDSTKNKIANLSKGESVEFDAVAYENFIKRKNLLTEEQKNSAAKIGAMEEQLRTAKKQFALNEQKKAQKIQIEKDLKLYSELSTLTRGDALKKFVAAEYMHSFTKRASALFSSLCKGTMELCFSDDSNEISVIDHLADNTVRSAASLSGGEKFIASLSLAVAISERLASGGSNVFLLDEGFGTLGEDSIDAVAAALTELALKSDCVIGVITHSTALINSISACIQVTKDSSGASQVTYRLG